MNCLNCAERVRLAFVTNEGQEVWDHPTHGNHTVCGWYKGMEPTDRVAVPDKEGDSRWPPHEAKPATGSVYHWNRNNGYPMFGKCSECGSSIRCEDRTADWRHLARL